jgi:hypothetical protein
MRLMKLAIFASLFSLTMMADTGAKKQMSRYHFDFADVDRGIHYHAKNIVMDDRYSEIKIEIFGHSQLDARHSPGQYAAFLLDSRKLTHLSLSFLGTKLRDTDINWIDILLGRQPDLVSLDLNLQDCGLSQSAATSIMQSLVYQRNGLRNLRLNFSHNHISEQGQLDVKELAAKMAHQEQHVVDLSENAPLLDLTTPQAPHRRGVTVTGIVGN